MKTRNSNIEIVRFLSAIGILLGHSASKGQGIACSDGLNNLFFHMIACLANMGSMVLAMISFYFMWNKNFSSKRIFRIWFQTFFYYSVIAIILLFIGKVDINRNVIQYLLPVCGRPYWFVTAWIVFSLFRPIIDYVLKVINAYKRACMSTIILFCIVPFLFNNSILDDELTLFIALYCLTVYLANLKRNTNQIWMYIGLFTISTLLMGMGNWVLQERLGLGSTIIDFTSSYSPLMLLCGGAIICLLLILPKKEFKFVNLLGSTALGIYLFHCHPLIKNDLFWQFFDFEKYINSKAIIIVLPIIVLATILCVLVMNYFEGKVFGLIIKAPPIRRMFILVDEKYNRLMDRLL